MVLNVKFVCNHGVGNTVMRFDQVDKISIHKGGDWYLVRAHHHGGLRDFEWSSKAVSDIEKLADAFAGLDTAGV